MSELTEQNLTRQQAEQEMACLRKIYASVRLLDPKTLAEEPCYPPWKNVHPCTSCVGREAMAGKCQCSKLETLGSSLYQVTARYVEVDGKPYVMEMILPLDASARSTLHSNELIYRDALTGAHNRRFYEEELKHKYLNAGVAMIDLDDFKTINDTYGHATGDAALKSIGYALRGIKPKSKMFYMREGFAATALSWITISIMGAVPFVLTGCIPNPVDAMFETVSGFTTTGASILPGVEGLPNGILFWRSFTHWIGGMGVLVFLLSLLPLTGGSHRQPDEGGKTPAPQVDKLVPKVQSTAKILYGIYFALTVVELCFLLAGGMNVFDSLLTAFGTAGTGGFGFKNDSFASFSPYIQWVVTVFMILFGVNFNAYFLLLLRRFRRAASSEEVRAYFAIILAAVAVITVNIRSLYGTFGEALRHAAFQVGSIITTTGFSSCDFDLWPTLAKEVLVLLMFVGACAGSTGGGIKVSRFLLMGKKN